MPSEFLDAVRTGCQPQPDRRVGMRILKILVAAQESAHKSSVASRLSEATIAGGEGWVVSSNAGFPLIWRHRE